jgi:hypothetical protein
MPSTECTNLDTRCPTRRRAVELPYLVHRVTQATAYTRDEAERGVLALYMIYEDLTAVDRMVTEFIACARCGRPRP